LNGKELTEKWKHPKLVLPGEVIVFLYSELGSAPCRPALNQHGSGPALNLIWYRASQALGELLPEFKILGLQAIFGVNRFHLRALGFNDQMTQ